MIWSTPNCSARFHMHGYNRGQSLGNPYNARSHHGPFAYSLLATRRFAISCARPANYKITNMNIPNRLERAIRHPDWSLRRIAHVAKRVGCVELAQNSFVPYERMLLRSKGARELAIV